MEGEKELGLWFMRMGECIKENGVGILEMEKGLRNL